MNLLLGLLLAIALLLLLLTQRDQKENAEEKNHEDLSRTEALVEEIENPARFDEAKKALLSMGPKRIPKLLSILESIDTHPFSLTPKQQAGLEEVLANFGPQLFLHARHHAQRVHRASPFFPSLVRVLRRSSSPEISPIIQHALDLPFAVLAPLTSKMTAAFEDPAPLFDAIQDSEGALLIPCLPLLSEHQPWRERLSKEHPEIAHQVACWRGENIVQRIEEALEHRKDAEGLIAIALEIEEMDIRDPRVQERLVRLASEPLEHATLGPWALLLLAESGFENTPKLLGPILRAPGLDDHHLSILMAVVKHTPQANQQALATALRSESPMVVKRALQLLVVHPLHDHLGPLLKALGRQRYSPLESLLAAPILARWGELREGILENVAKQDREIQLAAVELLAFFGTPKALPRLVELWGHKEYLDDLLLNAFEFVADDAQLPLLELLAEREDSFEEITALKRRVNLLSILHQTH